MCRNGAASRNFRYRAPGISLIQRGGRVEPQFYVGNISVEACHDSLLGISRDLA